MCNACIPIPAQDEPVDEFADRLIDMLNQGALSLMLSIGHRTGLFDAWQICRRLLKQRSPLTADCSADM